MFVVLPKLDGQLANGKQIDCRQQCKVRKRRVNMFCKRCEVALCFHTKMEGDRARSVSSIVYLVLINNLAILCSSIYILNLNVTLTRSILRSRYVHYC